MKYFVKEAIDLYQKGFYREAIESYKKASVVYGDGFFDANIFICENLIKRNKIVIPNFYFFNKITINSKKESNENLIFTILDRVGINRFKETYAEFMISEDYESAKLINNLIPDGKRKEVIDISNNRHQELKKIIPSKKQKILIAGHDLRFVQPYIEYLSKYYEIILDKWDGLNSHDEELSRNYCNQADVIWCEWCCGNAVFYSKNKGPSSKLFIRLHRFEYETNFPNLVNWNNVDSLIFIAEGIKEKVLKKFDIDCKISLLYNSFSVDNFVKESFKRKRNVFSLAMLGFMPKLKRLDLSLDLLDLLNTNINNKFKLYLKGKRPEELDWVWKKERDYFEKLYSRIDDNVVFEEYTNNVPSWMSTKGFLISSSDIEGSHQAVAEAMAAGTIPIIIGKWAFDYKAYRMYPSEFIFENLEDACAYIKKIISTDSYEKISTRVQQFAVDNFSVDVVMHSALELIQRNSIIPEYFPIEDCQSISILTDLNVNVVDGSSIWLMSIVDTILIDRNIIVNIFSKCDVNHSSEFNKYKDNYRVNIYSYPSDKEFNESDFLKFYLSYERNKPSHKTIVRAGAALTKEIIQAEEEVTSKIIYYIVGEFNCELKNLNCFDSILVQTNASFLEIKKILDDFGFQKRIVVLPPMIPDHYVPEEYIGDSKFNIVYSGKLCKDYMSMEMADYANTLESDEFFNIVASKFYKPDGDSYIKKTKSLLSSGGNNGKLTVLGPLPREEVADIIRKSKVGWLVRDQKFKNSSEISTKLLEYCALGKPVILNKFKSNIDLLGADYPLYIETIDDVRRVISELKVNPQKYKILSDYCAFVSSRYKMSSSFERLWSLLNSNKLSLDNEKMFSVIGFFKFEKYYKFIKKFEELGIDLEKIDEEWMLINEEKYKNKIIPISSSNSIIINIQGVLSEKEVGNVLIVNIRPNGKKCALKDFKISASGESFEYITLKNQDFFEKKIHIEFDIKIDFVEVEVVKWKMKSSGIVKIN